MNREQIIDWLQQSQIMLQQLGEMQKNVNQGKAIREMLNAQGEVERALKMASDLKSAEDLFEKSLQTILRKCKRATMAECETLLGDVSDRLKLADEAFGYWRAQLASHELESQLSQDVDARVNREAAIAGIRKRYEVALSLAEQAVPTPGVILL